MKLSIAVPIFSLAATSVFANFVKERALPLVQSNQLRRVLLRSELLAKSQKLEQIAYTTPGRNRVVGSPGHAETLKYISETVVALDYYEVTTQSFTVPMGNSTLLVGGTAYESRLMTFTPGGHPVAPLVAAANLGCDPADYPAEISGAIALISRGTCEFGLKSALAGAAGAIGVLIYNNVDGALSGTLGQETRPEGSYPPTSGISKADGLALLASLPQTGDLNIILVDVPTYNIIAQTKGGDPENVIQVGAHSDSVEAGPGINDNGSGSIGLLEIAIQLTKFSVNNAVRFSWWAAEEEGLIGATNYVESLSQEELDKIRLYLNFDMIASPNFVYGIYDGDGSAFNQSGPPGSAEAEKLFQEYFTNDAGLPWVDVDFSGRSDYGPFLEAGVASGGLFTGAEVLKTEEEAAIFGGQAGVAYDVNYHAAGDTVANLNMGAFIQNAKAIAHAIATYARSFDSLPAKSVKRSMPRTDAFQISRRFTEHDAHSHGHGCLDNIFS
ncbi:peptide hydrolase-5 [Coleophoma cylindrospora]|uniref:Peptide hydrolase n=1 Tax=Coleophoma cylindrospora TaxID=1849047 RepID=A0A3D8RTN6_9HELO|nr:peptide hydrolase-5 [Coleophoma cylindrospora]